MSFSRLYIALIVTGGLYGLCVGGSNIDPEDIIFHFHGPEPSSLIGGSITSLGDVNNDGYDDVAIGCFSPIGVYAFYGGDPPDSEPDMFFGGPWGSVEPIDMTGDGINEFITYGVELYDGVSRGVLYFHQGYLDSIASEPYDSIVSDTPFAANFFISRTAYVDGDEYGDIMTSFGLSKVFYFSGCPGLDKELDWSFGPENYSHYIYDFDFLDYDGDYYLDACVGMQARNREDTTSYIYIFCGPEFGQSPDIIIEEPVFLADKSQRFPWHVVNIGDYNGDLRDDLGVTCSAAGIGIALIYCGGTDSDTLFDYCLDGSTAYISGVDDINNDGYDDLACGGAGSWEGEVYLFSGGPHADTIIDEKITYIILPPVFLDNIGWRISSAGDFNNDGFDDVMFSCQNFSTDEPYDVFIMAGSEKIPTPVAEMESHSLPQRFELRQNYPNPFNPSTTIKYGLLKRTDVRLNIYDILGRQVVTLVDDTKPAGEYEITWDGMDAGGKPIASGLYFYRLEADGVSESRKMILLK